MYALSNHLKSHYYNFRGLLFNVIHLLITVDPNEMISGYLKFEEKKEK